MSAPVSGPVATGARPAVMSTAVVFDADETLLDLRPAVTGALVAVLEEMRRRAPAGLPRGTAGAGPAAGRRRRDQPFSRHPLS